MSNVLTNILNILFNYTNDWGIAIAVLTLGVKILLIPLSIKQKASMLKQQKFTEDISKIKLKYKNNEAKMNEELNKYYTQNTSSLMGCFIALIQLPIILTLFKVIRNINIDSGSILIPWVVSLKSYDSSYIIPLIYTIIALGPSILSYIEYIRGYNESKPMKKNIISIIILSLMLTLRSPAAIGIYFITSSFVTFIEEIIFRVIKRNGLLTQG